MWPKRWGAVALERLGLRGQILRSAGRIQRQTKEVGVEGAGSVEA